MPRTNSGPSFKRAASHILYDLRMRFPTTGNIWFVDSGASSGGNGLSPESAVTTIDAAINLATASNGDIIIVMEGHAETIASAAAIALDLAGITVVGLGRARNRPVITSGTLAAASIDITAANVHLENLVFVCGMDAQTAMINVQAADCNIINCEFQGADASAQAAVGILTNDSADRMHVEGCYFHGAGDTTAWIPIDSVGGDDWQVVNCNFQGYFGTTGAIRNGTTASVNVLIANNTIVNRTANANNKAISLHASTVGLVADNRIALIDATCPTPIDAAAAFVSHNYHTGAVGVTASVLI